MRLGSVLSEALRNIGSGVSRAFAMFLAVLLSGTLLGGYEAMTVIDLGIAGRAAHQRVR